MFLCSFNLVNLKGSTIVAHVTNSRNYVKKTIIRLYTHCLDLIFIFIIRPTCQDVLWYGVGVCLSVRPSVCPSVHKACRHDTDRTISARTVKLGTQITYDKRKNPIDFQGHGSKVKVTGYTLLLNLVNTIQTEPFQLGPSNLVHRLLMTRGRHLLIFKVMGQRSRSHATHCC